MLLVCFSVVAFVLARSQVLGMRAWASVILFTAGKQWEEGGGQLEAPAVTRPEYGRLGQAGRSGVEQNLGDEVRFTDCPERKNDRTAHWLLKLSSGSGTLILFLL